MNEEKQKSNTSESGGKDARKNVRNMKKHLDVCNQLAKEWKQEKLPEVKDYYFSQETGQRFFWFVTMHKRPESIEQLARIMFVYDADKVLEKPSLNLRAKVMDWQNKWNIDGIPWCERLVYEQFDFWSENSNHFNARMPLLPKSIVSNIPDEMQLQFEGAWLYHTWEAWEDARKRLTTEFKDALSDYDDQLKKRIKKLGFKKFLSRDFAWLIERLMPPKTKKRVLMEEWNEYVDKSSRKFKKFSDPLEVGKSVVELAKFLDIDLLRLR